VVVVAFVLPKTCFLCKDDVVYTFWDRKLKTQIGLCAAHKTVFTRSRVGPKEYYA
jgi:hypothetical protein